MYEYATLIFHINYTEFRPETYESCDFTISGAGGLELASGNPFLDYRILVKLADTLFPYATKMVSSSVDNFMIDSASLIFSE